MNHVSIADAEARFGELVTQAENGQSTEIVRHGKVVARLVPVDGTRPKIDVAALLEHQQSLTSPMEDTDTALRDWKDGSRY